MLRILSLVLMILMSPLMAVGALADNGYVTPPQGCFLNAEIEREAAEFAKLPGAHVRVVEKETEVAAFKNEINGVPDDVVKILFAWMDGEDAPNGLVLLIGKDFTCQKFVAPKNAIMRLLWKIDGEPA